MLSFTSQADSIPLRKSPHRRWWRSAFADSVERLEARAMLAITLSPMGSYATGIYEQSAAEIVTHDPKTQQLFVVSAAQDAVNFLDVRDPNHPTLVRSVDLSSYGSPNSVAFYRNLLAVAVEDGTDKTNPGKVVFLDTQGRVLNAVTVGALPDMLTFTPNGQYVMVANEGEPNDAYSRDPEGSISIIPVHKTGIDKIHRLRDADVVHARFTQFNSQAASLKASGVRIYGPGSTVAQDLEPEFITVSDDSKTAFVTLQENNAYATVDIRSGKVTRITPFGFKDHRLAANALDASDRDNAINIANWPVFGMYQPDAIASYKVKGKTYLVTANEGDSRAYTGFNEETRVGSLSLDPTAFPNAATLKTNANLGRLRVTNSLGDTDNDGDYDALYAFGGRSFSIWTEAGQLVFDSGSALEQITAAALPDFFNVSNNNNTKDDRSDDKGPEPEDVELGEIDGRTYAFIGLERVGGVIVYDITVPTAPTFIQYVNHRDFTQPVGPGAKDLAPEGLKFVSAKDSPTGKPLLITANEVSGTTTIFEIKSIEDHDDDDDHDDEDDLRVAVAAAITATPGAQANSATTSNNSDMASIATPGTTSPTLSSQVLKNNLALTASVVESLFSDSQLSSLLKAPSSSDEQDDA